MGVLSGIPRQRKVGPGEALSRIFLSGLSGYVKGREIRRQREAEAAEAAEKEEEKRYRRGRDAAADARAEEAAARDAERFEIQKGERAKSEFFERKNAFLKKQEAREKDIRERGAQKEAKMPEVMSVTERLALERAERLEREAAAGGEVAEFTDVFRGPRLPGNSSERIRAVTGSMDPNSDEAIAAFFGELTNDEANGFYIPRKDLLTDPSAVEAAIAHVVNNADFYFSGGTVDGRHWLARVFEVFVGSKKKKDIAAAARDMGGRADTTSVKTAPVKADESETLF